ncbi:DinB family protein [Gemmatimonas sp.]
MIASVSDTLCVLERTPATLRALLGELPSQWTSPNEGPDTFSAFDNVAHLVHGERADWMPRARIMLAQSVDKRFEPYDRFAHVHESAGKSMATLLDEFEVARRANLQELHSWTLTDDMLALTGEHPAFGEVSLRQLLATWAVHDLGHLAQIARVMAKQYREAVGPWRAYLPILDRP